jgi:hypothetical protein
MGKFPSSKRSSGNKAMGYLSARLEKRQLVVSTSVRTDSGWEREEVIIRPPKTLKLLFGSALFGPFLIAKGERPDYSLMVSFAEAVENGWEDPPEEFVEGVKLDVEIQGIGRLVWTSSQTTVRDLLWTLCGNWHEAAPEHREEDFLFTGWRKRTNPVSGNAYGVLQLEPTTASDGGSAPSTSASPYRPRRDAGPRLWGEPEGGSLEDDAIPF